MKALHTYKTFISFSETDASGRIYYGSIYMVAHKAIEDFAFQNKIYDNWFANPDWATPVVHSEADYKKELRSGSPVTIEVYIDKIGTTSFNVRFEFINEGDPAATVKVTHVSVDLKTKKPRPVPEELRRSFEV